MKIRTTHRGQGEAAVSMETKTCTMACVQLATASKATCELRVARCGREVPIHTMPRDGDGPGHACLVPLWLFGGVAGRAECDELSHAESDILSYMPKARCACERRRRACAWPPRLLPVQDRVLAACR
jgi:hypothetical protein